MTRFFAALRGQALSFPGSASVHLPQAYHGFAMLRPILVVFALSVSGLAAGQATEAPARIAQLAYVEGALSYQEANEPASSALPERPLEAGDRLTTAREGRAELTLGSAVVRLDQDSDLAIVDLDASSVRFELMSGAAIFRVDELYE